MGLLTENFGAFIGAVSVLGVALVGYRQFRLSQIDNRGATDEDIGGKWIDRYQEIVDRVEKQLQKKFQNVVDGHELRIRMLEGELRDTRMERDKLIVENAELKAQLKVVTQQVIDHLKENKNG